MVTEIEVGEPLGEANLVNCMLSNKDNWIKIGKLVDKIMCQKQIDERSQQERGEN